MIESFGGRVTAPLGVTDILVVGKSPDSSRLARRGTATSASWGCPSSRKRLRWQGVPLSMATPLVITEYSKGYQGNGGGANRLTVGGGGASALDHKNCNVLAEISEEGGKEAAAGGSSSGGSASQQSRPLHRHRLRHQRGPWPRPLLDRATRSRQLRLPSPSRSRRHQPPAPPRIVRKDTRSIQ